MYQSLVQGIKKVSIVAAASLPARLAERAAAGDVPRLLVRPEKLCTYGEPVMVVSTDNSHYGQTQEVRLSFRSVSRILSDVPYCFMVGLVNGSTVLIGTSEPPYCLIEESRQFGDPASKSPLFEYNVTYRAMHTPVEVKV